MKSTKDIFSFLFFGSTALVLIATLIGCGEDPGLYQQEILNFESGKDSNNESESKLDLGADEANEFGFWPPAFFPAPIFPYYNEPVPVAVPISPYQAITEWVHPMYAIGMFQPFWPALFGP